MELRHLRSFVIVAEELHVHRAAARLHVTQPTVSRQIAALERAVGTPLFVRAQRRITLTPAGQVLLDGARDLLARADTLERDVDRAGRGELGTVRLGFVQSATFHALPTLVGAFREQYPDVVLDVVAMTSLEQLEALAADQLDAGLLRPPDALVDLPARPVSRDPLLVAVPSGHPLVSRERIRLSELADEPFVFYSRPEGPAVHDAIVACCRQAGFSPRIVQAARDAQTLVALVAAGLGVSLVIGPAPPDHDGRVVYRHLVDDTPMWELTLAWCPRAVGPALASLLEVAGRVLPEP